MFENSTYRDELGKEAYDDVASVRPENIVPHWIDMINNVIKKV